MRLRLSVSAARAGMLAAMTARMFCGLMVEATELHNGAWLSALIGLGLAFPFALWWNRRPLNRALSGLLAVFLALDAAAMARITAFSAGYLAFDHIPTLWLAAPMLLVALRCACLGGDAIGWSARIWLRAFAVLLLIVALVQWHSYHPRWLTPVLGYGWRGILSHALSAAGWMLALSAGGGSLVEAEREHLRLWRVMGLAALLSVLMIALRLMMTPAMRISETMTDRLDSLLTNGRSPLLLQLPIIVMWYIAQTHLISFQCFAAAGLLQRCWPKLDGHLCAVIATVAIGMALLLNTQDVSGLIWLLLPLGLWPLGRKAKACA